MVLFLLIQLISNLEIFPTDLLWGNSGVDDYETYIKDLKEKQNKFIVATPADFDRRITVTKLRNWVKQYKLDMIAIDGITYLTDEFIPNN